MHPVYCTSCGKKIGQSFLPMMGASSCPSCKKKTADDLRRRQRYSKENYLRPEKLDGRPVQD